jgi:hypothetical protein
MLLPAIGEHPIAEGRIPWGRGVSHRVQRRPNSAHLLPGIRARAPLDEKALDGRRGLGIVPCEHHLSSPWLVGGTRGRREAGHEDEDAQYRSPHV